MDSVFLGRPATWCLKNRRAYTKWILCFLAALQHDVWKTEDPTLNGFCVFGLFLFFEKFAVLWTPWRWFSVCGRGCFKMPFGDKLAVSWTPHIGPTWPMLSVSWARLEAIFEIVIRNWNPTSPKPTIVVSEIMDDVFCFSSCCWTLLLDCS